MFIVNLMTKYGQTTHFKASDFCYELSKYLGGMNPDYILINNTLKLNKKIAARYAEERAEPVIDDLSEHPENLAGTTVIRGDFTNKQIFEKSKGDKLIRSLVRHDSKKLAKAIISILK